MMNKQPESHISDIEQNEGQEKIEMDLNSNISILFVNDEDKGCSQKHED
jgi:hypothetical protein